MNCALHSKVRMRHCEIYRFLRFLSGYVIARSHYSSARLIDRNALSEFNTGWSSYDYSVLLRSSLHATLPMRLSSADAKLQRKGNFSSSKPSFNFFFLPFFSKYICFPPAKKLLGDKHVFVRQEEPDFPRCMPIPTKTMTASRFSSSSSSSFTMTIGLAEDEAEWAGSGPAAPADGGVPEESYFVQSDTGSVRIDVGGVAHRVKISNFRRERCHSAAGETDISINRRMFTLKSSHIYFQADGRAAVLAAGQAVPRAGPPTRRCTSATSTSSAARPPSTSTGTGTRLTRNMRTISSFQLSETEWKCNP